jgi:hypothetical protein
MLVARWSLLLEFSPSQDVISSDIMMSSALISHIHLMWLHASFALVTDRSLPAVIFHMTILFSQTLLRSLLISRV